MKITRKEFPTLFNSIRDLIVENSVEEHRRGSSFYTKSIIEILSEDEKHWPDIPDFQNLVGNWETNRYISSEDYTDWDEINELTKVHCVEETIINLVWKPIED